MDSVIADGADEAAEPLLAQHVNHLGHASEVISAIDLDDAFEELDQFLLARPRQEIGLE